MDFALKPLNLVIVIDHSNGVNMFKFIFLICSPEITVENGFKLSQRLSQTMWKHMRFFVRQNCPIVLEWPVNPNQRQLVTCNGKAASIIVLQF